MAIAAKKVFDKWRKDPAYKKAYEALEEEFVFAGALLKARQEAGLTQAQVAARMKSTQSVVARLEGGKKPSWSTLERYARAVGKRLRIALV
jgi:ribosome-binding protein aMBF1 (putative translation factor)